MVQLRSHLAEATSQEVQSLLRSWQLREDKAEARPWGLLVGASKVEMKRHISYPGKWLVYGLIEDFKFRVGEFFQFTQILG